MRMSLCASWIAVVFLAGCAHGPWQADAPPRLPAHNAGHDTGSLVRHKAPDFKAKAVFPDNKINDLELSSFRGKYVVLVFYPADFSIVCPTEMIAFSKELDTFQSRECEIIGISVDSVYSHLAWRTTPEKKGGIGPIRFPLVSDSTKSIAKSYGILADKDVALRTTVLVDKTGTVRHMLVNDLPIGRDIAETLRVLDAVRFVDTYGELCPADWNPGDKTLPPTPQEKIGCSLSAARPDR